MKTKLTTFAAQPERQKLSPDEIYGEYLKMLNIIEGVLGPRQTWSREMFNHIYAIMQEMCATISPDQTNTATNAPEINR